MGRADRRPSVDAEATRRSTSAPAARQYFLLWFTKASEAHDQAGRYQVEISDIKLLRAELQNS